MFAGIYVLVGKVGRIKEAFGKSDVAKLCYSGAVVLSSAFRYRNFFVSLSHPAHAR